MKNVVLEENGDLKTLANGWSDFSSSILYVNKFVGQLFKVVGHQNSTKIK